MTYLYLVEAIGIDRAKVGMSRDPFARVETLSVGSPVDLRILAIGVLEEGKPIATDKHAHEWILGQCGISPVRGEWFRLSDLRASWSLVRRLFLAEYDETFRPSPLERESVLRDLTSRHESRIKELA